MKKVAAGLRDHVDKSRSLASEFRGIQRLLYFELLNGIDGWTDHQVVEVFIRNLHSIQEINVMATALTKHRRQCSGLFQSAAAGAARRDDDAVAQE